MKRLMSAIVALAFVASVPLVGQAQTSTDRTATDRSAKPAKAERMAWTNSEKLHDTKDLIGTRIKDAQGKDIGEIDALLIDPKDGKVSHAVVGAGGLLGLGEDKVVVKWSELKMGAHQDGKKAVVTMDKSVLDQAPKYEKKRERTPAASPATTPRSQ